MIKARELLVPDWREEWADVASTSDVGVVYTKLEIAAWILDLAGYDTGKKLSALRLLDPGCGGGAFVLEAVRRLSVRVVADGGDWNSDTLSSAIAAVDLDGVALARTRDRAVEILRENGCPTARAKTLSATWFINGDFLLHEWPEGRFDFVVGNPPYVRIEDLPKRLLSLYRDRFTTANERADLYIPFFELGLSLLSNDGVLAFICANRFAKNRYGGDLRKLIGARHHVRGYLNLEHTQPFEGKVSAYPAVVILDNRRGQPTAAATISDVLPETLADIARAFTGKTMSDALHRFDTWYEDGSPWINTCPREDDFHSVIARFPLLEDSAQETRVGIGVATGADEIFALREKPEGVEDPALLPLLMAGDITPGALRCSGHRLVNPFRENGTLMDETDAPGLMRFMRSHETRLRQRHCAKKTPARWYRTIDRIWPQWVAMPKLVIPDIQAGGIIGFDEGAFYPHHNVYWITSKGWNLHALQTLLRSDLVTRQIRAHSVQMRGGAIRYQTQSLRRVRIPSAESLSRELIERLAKLGSSGDLTALNAAAAEAFGIPPS